MIAGAKCHHGETWHSTENEVESIKTHAHWCMQNCNSNPDNLQASLLNAVEHYKNHHDNCHEDPRCRKDQNYEPSKVIIQSQIAEQLLMDALMKSILYRNAEDYFMALNTYLVESFNNMLNIFHDKQISFKTKQYRLRSDLALLRQLAIHECLVSQA